ncbi:unnamed protein product, partial [Allacma fusca]
METNRVMKEIRPELGPTRQDEMRRVLQRPARRPRTTTITRRRPFLSVSVTLSSLLFLLLTSSSFLFPSVMSHIHINENGGYENIIVSIGKEVPPIACQQLIQNIQ